MTYKLVKSSSIQGVNYNPEDRTLHIQWKTKGVSTYHNVKPSTYQSFMTAPSKRKYLNEHIHGKHIVIKKIKHKA